MKWLHQIFVLARCMCSCVECKKYFRTLTYELHPILTKFHFVVCK